VTNVCMCATEVRRLRAPVPTPTPTGAYPLSPASWSAYRLPTFVVPSHYDVYLDVDVDAGTYLGVVDLALRVRHGRPHSPQERTNGSG
jgi:hypothetical protein